MSNPKYIKYMLSCLDCFLGKCCVSTSDRKNSVDNIMNVIFIQKAFETDMTVLSNFSSWSFIDLTQYESDWKKKVLSRSIILLTKIYSLISSVLVTLLCSPFLQLTVFTFVWPPWETHLSTPTVIHSQLRLIDSSLTQMCTATKLMSYSFWGCVVTN